MEKAPICIVAYNRYENLNNLLDSVNISDNKRDVYIFVDGPKSTKDFNIQNKIISLSEKYDYQFIFRKENIGLRNNIISSINFVLNLHNVLIVLEDDLIISRHALDYFDYYLDIFSKDNTILSISGYTPNIDFIQKSKELWGIQRISSWGFATWKDRWNKVEFDPSIVKREILANKFIKEIKLYGNDLYYQLINQVFGVSTSWAIFFDYHAYKYKMKNIYNYSSLIYNDGFNGKGTNKEITKKYDVNINDSDFVRTNNYTVFTDAQRKIFKNFYNYNYKSALLSIYNRYIKND